MMRSLSTNKPGKHCSMLGGVPFLLAEESYLNKREVAFETENTEWNNRIRIRV